MAITVMLAPSGVPNQSFPCPSGNSYLSSANGLLINVANQTDVNYLKSVGARIVLPRDNFVAGTPTSANDASQLYDTGSIWINIGSSPNTVYVCQSGFPLGGAVWNLLAAGGAGLGSIAVENSPLRVGAGGTGTTSYGPIDGTNQAVAANYTVLSTDKRKTLYKSANGQYTLTVGAPGGYDADHQNRIQNPPGNANGWLMSISGITAFYLYPGQTIELFKEGANWQTNPTQAQMPRWWSTGPLYVDPAKSDSNDGITAASALATIQAAGNMYSTLLDVGRSGGGIQLQAGTHNAGAGTTWFYPAVGKTAVGITGDLATPTNVIVAVSAGSTMFMGRDLSTVILQGIDAETSGNAASILGISQGCTFDFQSAQAGAFPLGLLFSVSGAGGSINVTGPMKLTGNFISGADCSENSHMQFGDSANNCNLPNALTFTFFLVIGANGVTTIGPPGYTYTGAGAGAGSTGSKFSNSGGGRLILSGGHTLPGATAGTTDAATFASTS